MSDTIFVGVSDVGVLNVSLLLFVFVVGERCNCNRGRSGVGDSESRRIESTTLGEEPNMAAIVIVGEARRCAV
jgi:hypothetical protein